MLHRIWLVTLLVAVVHGDENVGECVLPVPRFAFFMPLVFSPTGDLVQTKHIENITLLPNDRVVLSCYPGYFKKIPTEQVLRASCQNHETLTVNGEAKNWLKDLACEVRAIEEILTPVDGCPPEMESVEFGYANPIKEKTFVLGEACYSVNQGHTFLIHVKVGDPANRQIAHLRTENINYLKKAHPTSKYKIDLLLAARIDELQDRLRTKLRTPVVPFLEPRHFFGAASLQSKQFSPMMKLGWNFFVSNGYDLLPNWDSLQKDIMQLTAGGRTFDLYAGHSGVLSLPDIDGRDNNIYLDDEEQRFPVAKYLWLIVREDDRAAAFVILNSNGLQPTSNDAENDEICSSRCDEMPWLTNLTEDNAHTEVQRGKVWCCDLASIPKIRSDFSVLNGNLTLLI